VTLPVAEKCLFIHSICEERLWMRLRADDPLASAKTISLNVIAAR
jgi:hypothetical protein